MTVAYDVLSERNRALQAPPNPAPSPVQSGDSQSKLLDLFEALTKATARQEEESEALEHCLAAVCSYTRWPMGHIYTLNEENMLVSSRIWHLAEHTRPAHVSQFQEQSENTTFKPGEGLVGRVFANRSAMSIPDVLTEKKFLRARAAKQAGMHGYFAFPICVDNAPLAVMEFLSFEEAALKPELIRLMGFVGEQTGRILERKNQRLKLQKMRKLFEAEVGQVVQAVASAATELSSTAASLTKIVEDASVQGEEADAAATHVLNDMRSLQEATRSMLAQAEEIGSRTEQSVQFASDAEQVGHTASDKLTSLKKAVEGVNSAVSMVRQITKATKMLALNATIEAARAGIHGNGFAVVAGEVKALAGQTDGVTTNIEQLVANIRDASDNSTTSLEQMGDAILHLNGLSKEMADAVTSQFGTSQQMAALTAEAAERASLASEHAQEVGTSLKNAATAADEVEHAALLLSRQGEQLATSVGNFLESLI